MKRSLIALTLISSLLSLNTFGQSKQRSNVQPTVQAQPVSKVDKTIAGVDTTLDRAKTTATKAAGLAKDVKGLAEDIFGRFGSKTPNEGAIVIPSIEFDDSNLAMLLDAVKDRKEVKKATLEYNAGTATIRMTLRGKSQADFWVELPKTVREHFKLRSKQENNILVDYAGNTGTNQLVQK